MTQEQIQPRIQERFEGYRTFGDPVLQRAKLLAMQLCQDIAARKSGYILSLMGTEDTGKTFLAKMVWRFWKEQGRYFIHSSGAQMSLPGMFVDWREFRKEMLEKNYRFEDEICDASFVVLDDVGVEYDPSGFMANEMETVVHMRMGKFTLFISNKTMDWFEQLDRRVASRLQRGGNRLIEMNTTPFSERA